MKSLFTILFIFISLTTIAAQDLQIKSSNTKYSNFLISYDFLDKSREFSNVLNHNFEKSTKSNFALGANSKTLWLKFKVKNDSNISKFIFTLNETFYETANIYFKENGEWKKKENSLYTKLTQREVEFNKLSFKLELKKNYNNYIFIELRGQYSYFGNVEIITEKEFYKKLFLDANNLYVFILGISFVVSLFSVVTSIILKNRLYFYYAGYSIFNFIYLCKMSGLLTFVNLQEYIYVLHSSAPLFIGFLALFSFEFLDIKKYFKKSYKYFFIIPYTFFILAILLSIQYQPWIKVLNVLSLLFTLFMLILSFYIYLVEKNINRFYFYAIFIYFISAMCFLLMVAGVVEYSFLSRNALVIGSSAENILFMILIILRYNYLKNEMENKLLEKVEDRTRKLKHLANEKELILRELYHRVKNNFHMIIGMLWLEDKKDEKLKHIIARVKSMALINELLYKSNDLSDINIEKYFSEILKNITSSYKVTITSKYTLSKTIPMKNAINLGMILNEIVTNSVKHNIKDQLNIDITIKSIEDNIYLIIKDNGKGFDIDKNSKGIGLKMVKDFCKKLYLCQYRYEFEDGTKFILMYSEGTE